MPTYKYIKDIKINEYNTNKCEIRRNDKMENKIYYIQI